MGWPKISRDFIGFNMILNISWDLGNCQEILRNFQVLQRLNFYFTQTSIPKHCEKITNFSLVKILGNIGYGNFWHYQILNCE